MSKIQDVNNIKDNLEGKGLYVFTGNSRRYDNNTNKATSRNTSSFNHNKLKAIKPVLGNSVIPVKKRQKS